MAQFFSPKHSTTGDLADPYRVVRVGPKSPLQAGDVLVHQNRKYLMLYTGADEASFPGATVFKALELDQTAQIYRKTKTLDPITKRTNETDTLVGWMDYAAEPTRQAEDSLRIQYNNYEILTDFDIRVGDLVDKKLIVQQVEIRQGITWARMRDV